MRRKLPTQKLLESATIATRRFRAPLDTRRIGRPAPKAFTVFEVLVVLLVMSILAAAAAPSFYKSLHYHRLESAARRVKQDLEFLRDAARAKSTTLTCEFDQSGYAFTDNSVLQLNHTAAYSVDLSAHPFHLDSMSADFGNETTIAFDGYGTTAQDRVIVLSLGGNTRTITRDSSTGQITITNP